VRRPPSRTASGTSRHNSCRSLRERFQNGQVSGLDDELTITSIRYEINPRGQVQIESKDQAKKRGIRSQDRAEALMLAFADRTPGILRYYEEQIQTKRSIVNSRGRPGRWRRRTCSW
jgi:hypothetical protein